jgi:hypothetical protein
MTEQEESTKVQKWLGDIATYDKEFKKWETRVDKILKRYRDDRGARSNETARFNILWSNVQTIVPAVFARLPKPDVSRRFVDNDPVGRVAALILERALEFEIEHYQDYRAAMKNSVMDRYLGGRGVSWVRYEPHFQAAQQGMPADGVQITEDADQGQPESAAGAEAEPQEEIAYECAPVDYVHWKDFGHKIARTWEEVPVVWRKVYMSRPALVARFGKKLGNKIPLDTRPDDQKNKPGDEGTFQALVYEIWDKESGNAIWLSKSMGKILDERPDPLELETFYPCPRPLFATLTTDSLIPTPDFTLYQDQAAELDLLCERIDGLVKALQVRGVHDAAIPELARLFTEAGNTDLIPIKNWQAFSEKNRLGGSIDIVDLAPIASALGQAYQAFEQIKNQVYEIMGIADILRGATDPGETLGAQKIKGQFGSLRLKSMQGEVVQYATEILQIKAQVMCRFFQPETLVKISAADQLSEADKPHLQDALALLKNEPLRNFRIEISSDSMVQMDEAQEKQDRAEFLKAVSGFIKESLSAPPQMAPLLGTLLKFGVGGFKVGKTVEGEIDRFVEQAKEYAAKEAAAPPKQDPGMLKLQFEQQARAQEMQQKFALEQQSNQMKMQLEAHKQEMQAQQIEHQNQVEAQRMQLQQDNDARLEQMRMLHEKSLEESRQVLAVVLKRIEGQTKIEVSEASKATVLGADQVGAAQAAQPE